MPKLANLIVTDHNLQLMGRSFAVSKEGSKALLFIGSEHLLDTFVIPNVGTDYNLYFCNKSLLNSPETVAVERVLVR